MPNSNSTACIVTANGLSCVHLTPFNLAAVYHVLQEPIRLVRVYLISSTAHGALLIPTSQTLGPAMPPPAKFAQLANHQLQSMQAAVVLLEQQAHTVPHSMQLLELSLVGCSWLLLEQY
jgi:hypothetical protein